MTGAEVTETRRARSWRSRPRSPCLWCEKMVTGSYCSHHCAIAHARTNYGPCRRVRQEMQKLAEAGPKGCTSVEEFLAKGGKIIRVEALPAPPGGNPARGKASDFGGGRVRR